MERHIELLRSDDPFIRRRLEYGAFVGRRYPYLYLETPKAACTSTKYHLWRIEGLGEITDNLGRVHERPADDERLSLASAPEPVALDALAGRGYLRFVVWRDPIDRLRSAYWDKIRLGRDQGPEWDEWRDAIRQFCDLPEGREINFDDFVSLVCAVPDEHRDTHFMSQPRLTLWDRIDYDVIVRADDYDAGMIQLFRRLGVPEAEWPDLTPQINYSGSRVVPVTRQSLDRIRETYAASYLMYETAARDGRALSAPRADAELRRHG